MTGRVISLKNYKLDPKSGKLVRCVKHLDVSARLRLKSSKKVRAVKRNKGIGFL